MNIVVSARPEPYYNLGFLESPKVEFKTSLFFAPANAKRAQVETVAQTIAAFMNADGGDLYLGVDNGGNVVGIDSDLNELVNCSPKTVVMGWYANDASYVDTYCSGDVDQYLLKLNMVIKGFLGPFAMTLVDGAESIKDPQGRTYVKLHIRSASGVETVLFRSRNGNCTELWTRAQTSKQLLRDEYRDKFVFDRAIASRALEFKTLAEQLTQANARRADENNQLRLQIQELKQQNQTLFDLISSLGKTQGQVEKQISEEVKKREETKAERQRADKERMKQEQKEFDEWQKKFQSLWHPLMGKR